MGEKNLQNCSNQVDILFQEGHSLCESHPQELDLFSPNIGQHIYDRQLYNRSVISAKSKKILYDIGTAKDQICTQISDVLLTDPAFFVHNMFYTKKICDMKSRLLTVESNVFNYPFSRFVERVIDKGTMIDIIGTIERLKYDLLNYDIKQDPWCASIDANIVASHPDRIRRNIQLLLDVFETRYSSTAYAQIQDFKERYLQMHISTNTIPNISQTDYVSGSADEVLSKEQYVKFFVALESALFKNIFPGSKEIYTKELEKIMNVEK